MSCCCSSWFGGAPASSSRVGAVLLLVLGAGWEDLLWAFQIQFIGSVACGLGMLLALQAPASRRNLLIAAALLTASLMFSGVGLFFGVAAVVQLVAYCPAGADLLWFAPTGVALAVWFLAFGRSGGQTTPYRLAMSPPCLSMSLWGLGPASAG